MLVTAETLPRLEHITAATHTASSARCVSSRRREVVCGHGCGTALPRCQDKASRMALLGRLQQVASASTQLESCFNKGTEKLQSWIKKAVSALLIEVKALVCSSISTTDCVQAGSGLAARFCFMILFHFLLSIFAIGFYSGTIFKQGTGSNAHGVNITQGNLCFFHGKHHSTIVNLLLQELKSSILKRKRAASLQFCEISLGIITMFAYGVFRSRRALMNIMNEENLLSSHFKHFTKTISKPLSTLLIRFL